MELSCRIQPCQGCRLENEVVWLRQYRLLLRKIRSACLLAIRMLQAVYAFIGSHHLMEAFVPPSSRYPDIYPVTNVLLSFSVFSLAWLVASWKLLEMAVGMVGLGDLGSARPVSSSVSIAKKGK
jgi:hypothetical protein